MNREHWQKKGKEKEIVPLSTELNELDNLIDFVANKIRCQKLRQFHKLDALDANVT
jgi:hypothetical protein